MSKNIISMNNEYICSTEQRVIIRFKRVFKSVSQIIIIIIGKTVLFKP
jgi:hypothetical protein